MSKEAIKNLLIDFMADYDPNKWSNDDVYEKYAEKIDKVRSMGEIIAFTELAKKFKNLEAKLTLAKMNESFEKEKKDNAFKFIEELKQQLAEKEKEIKSLRTRQFIDMTEKEMLELKIATHNQDLKKIRDIFNQSHNQTAIEVLEKVKEYADIDYRKHCYINAVELDKYIDKQIKELKGGK